MKTNNQALFVMLCCCDTAVFEVPHPHGLAKGTNNAELAKDVHQSGRIFAYFRHRKGDRFSSNWLPCSGSSSRFFLMFFKEEKLVKSGYFAWAFSFSQRLSDLFCFLSIG